MIRTKTGDLAGVKGSDPGKVLLADLLWRRTVGIAGMAGGEAGDEISGERESADPAAGAEKSAGRSV